MARREALHVQYRIHALRVLSRSSKDVDFAGDLVVCEQCRSLEESRRVHCALCGKTRCSSCSLDAAECNIHDKLICGECISGLHLETSSLLQEELDVKDQINLNLKRGLEEQFQVISKCKQFIMALEEMISFQGLWKSICEIESTESTENIQNILFESQGRFGLEMMENICLELFLIFYLSSGNPKVESEKQTVGDRKLKLKITANPTK